MSDALKYLTINDAKYYESNTATANEAQIDSTRNPETVEILKTFGRILNLG